MPRRKINRIFEEDEYDLNTFPVYKKMALRAVKELQYPEEIYKRIKHAKTEGEIEQIMHSARNRYL